MRFTIINDAMAQRMYGNRSQLWTIGVIRTERYCILCGNQISKGERVFRPITNQNNRMDRCHAECVKKNAANARPLKERDV